MQWARCCDLSSGSRQSVWEDPVSGNGPVKVAVIGLEGYGRSIHVARVRD